MMYSILKWFIKLYVVEFSLSLSQNEDVSAIPESRRRRLHRLKWAAPFLSEEVSGLTSNEVCGNIYSKMVYIGPLFLSGIDLGHYSKSV